MKVPSGTAVMLFGSAADRHDFQPSRKASCISTREIRRGPLPGGSLSLKHISQSCPPGRRAPVSDCTYRARSASGKVWESPQSITLSKGAGMLLSDSACRELGGRLRSRLRLCLSALDRFLDKVDTVDRISALGKEDRIVAGAASNVQNGPFDARGDVDQSRAHAHVPGWLDLVGLMKKIGLRSFLIHDQTIPIRPMLTGPWDRSLAIPVT